MGDFGLAVELDLENKPRLVVLEGDDLDLENVCLTDKVSVGFISRHDQGLGSARLAMESAVHDFLESLESSSGDSCFSLTPTLGKAMRNLETFIFQNIFEVS